MMMFAIFYVFIVVIANEIIGYTSSLHIRIPMGYEELGDGNSQFLIIRPSTNEMSHTAAKGMCEGIGAHLLVVENEAMRTTLMNYMVNNSLNNLWVDGQRYNISSPWKHWDGSTVSYTGAAGYSNGWNEKCWRLTMAKAYNLVDATCGSIFYYACQIRQMY